MQFKQKENMRNIAKLGEKTSSTSTVFTFHNNMLHLGEISWHKTKIIVRRINKKNYITNIHDLHEELWEIKLFTILHPQF